MGDDELFLIELAKDTIRAGGEAGRYGRRENGYAVGVHPHSARGLFRHQKLGRAIIALRRLPVPVHAGRQPQLLL